MKKEENLLIEDKLLEAEKSVLEKNVAKEQEMIRKDEHEDVEELSKEERYSRLMDLLSKSTFYSNFIKEKMENSTEAEQLKQKNIKIRQKLKQDEEKKVRTTTCCWPMPTRLLAKPKLKYLKRLSYC